ncbi:Acyl-CoA synthetase [Phaffia rhodozyma]|uniref:Acyl-CoA synthetase n=1 Tax=Phaffia rhodozyma TaxID=264483 RepID=A0A0F7SHD1_PHARH|nr:Acyl-CoA synthetase [Phaffia rhodozyma]
MNISNHSSAHSPSYDVESVSPFPEIPIESLPVRNLYSHLLPLDSPFSKTSPAFIDALTEKSLSRNDLRHEAGKIAKGLNSELGLVRRKETVGIFLANGLDWAEIFLAAQRGGWPTALFASSLSSTDLSRQLELSRPEVTFTSTTLLPTLQAAYSLLLTPPSSSEIQRKTVLIDSSPNVDTQGFRTLDGLKADISLEQVELEDRQIEREGEDIAQRTSVICFSSGTEGLSKGVETTHHNLTSLMTMMKPPVFPTLDPAKDSMLGLLPFSHIYGLFKLMLLPLQHGFPMVIVPKIDLRAICHAIQTYKVTCAIVVPPILIHLASSKVVDKYDLSSLDWLLSGAASLGKDLIHKVEARFSASNTIVLQGYGLTETSPVTHILQLSDTQAHPGSIGRLIPNVEARLVDQEGKDVVPDKEGSAEGEMWIKGPNVMKGYLGNPEATRDTIDSDGWLKTGDIARVDPNGYFWLVDRRKELIKYNGHQVAPAELEILLLTHPGVADVGVVGIWSESEKSEVPRAFVAPSSTDDPLTHEAETTLILEIQDWMKTKVASHKLLRGGIVLIDQIPRSASGKILRRKLRDLASTSPGHV